MRADRGGEGHILLAIDGEPHTRNATTWALGLAEKLGWPITAVHVKDHYLKRFYNDLYAQGREEYLDHIDNCLEEMARKTEENFKREARRIGAVYEIKILIGDPLDVIVTEVRNAMYRLLVLGKKNISGTRAWRSRNLPKSILNTVVGLPVITVVGLPVMIVPGSPADKPGSAADMLESS